MPCSNLEKDSHQFPTKLPFLLFFTLFPFYSSSLQLVNFSFLFTPFLSFLFFPFFVFLSFSFFFSFSPFFFLVLLTTSPFLLFFSSSIRIKVKEALGFPVYGAGKVKGDCLGHSARDSARLFPRSGPSCVGSAASLFSFSLRQHNSIYGHMESRQLAPIGNTVVSHSTLKRTCLFGFICIAFSQKGFKQ